MDEEPPRSATLPPGYDEEDPYEGEDLATYPEWWRQNIQEFREYGMRPYRPPRLSDGTLIPPLINELEENLDINIELRAINPHKHNNWDVLVNDEQIATIKRTRESQGFSLFLISSYKLKSLIKDSLD